MFNVNDKMYDLDDLLIKINNLGYEKFTDFAKDVIKTCPNGILVDTLMPMYACNILKHSDISNFNSNFLRIEVDDINDFLKIAKDSRASFASLGDMGVFCVYNDFELFPVARVYSFQSSDITSYTKVLAHVKKYLQLNVVALDPLLDEKNAKTRISEYLSNLEIRLAKITRFVQGKIDNTSVTGGIVIARKDNICGNCNLNSADKLESITTTSLSSGIQISMEVCSSCLSSEASRNIILKAIFSNISLEQELTARELKSSELREISNNIVKYYLNLSVKTYASDTQDTITATTNDNFTVKLRITTIKNYGYMILNPEGEEVVRFDSAPDHPDKVEFMPHHVHRDVKEEELIKKKAKKLSKKKSKELKKKIDITDSFLSGFLGIDYIAINDHLKDLTDKYIKSGI